MDMSIDAKGNERIVEEIKTTNLTVDSILVAENFQKTWRAVKKNYQEQLVREPFDLLAYEVQLESNLKKLEYLVQTDKYRPKLPLIIRAAKRDGMTRALSFLDITDTIIIKTITDKLQSSLHKDFPSCVGFSRSQQKAFRSDEEDYDTWIQAWLRHQGFVNDLLQYKGCDYVVKSDVSNFFPSLSHHSLRHLVLQRTSAEEKLVNLLFFIIEYMSWRPGYCINREVGIPQEDHDSSRILAHTYMVHTDNYFAEEIEEGRYVRWVDDFIIAVRTQQEGKTILKKIEQALENSGLFINSAKSKIITKEHFAQSMFDNENNYLDEIHKITMKAHEDELYGHKEHFDEKLMMFLSIPEEKRIDNWDRVLRRFYTESRRIGSVVLENHALDHLGQYPSCARNIFKYLSTASYSINLQNSIYDYLKSGENIYEDIEIYCYEFLLKWAVSDERSIHGGIANIALDHFFARNGFSKPLTEYARGLISLLIYKYGLPADIAKLANYFLTDTIYDSAFSSYIIYILISTESYKDKALEAAVKYEDVSVRRVLNFLQLVSSNPSKVEKLLKQYTSVRDISPPGYKFFPARMLPLARITRSNLDFREEWDNHLARVLDELKKSKKNYDCGSIRLIESELEKP